MLSQKVWPSLQIFESVVGWHFYKDLAVQFPTALRDKLTRLLVAFWNPFFKNTIGFLNPISQEELGSRTPAASVKSDKPLKEIFTESFITFRPNKEHNWNWNLQRLHRKYRFIISWDCPLKRTPTTSMLPAHQPTTCSQECSQLSCQFHQDKAFLVYK